MRITRLFLICFVASMALFGCKENINQFDPDEPIEVVDPAILKFDASAFVEVLDAQGRPVEDATISLGMVDISTNEFGVAFLKDVEMGSVTYLTVNKPGFFHGSRRFYPSEGRTSHIRVILLDEIIAGEFTSAQGGKVQTDAVDLDFPADAIMDGAGNTYSGTVQVAMAAISADDENLSDKMPGDLVGETLSGEPGALASFGMAVVELQTPDGQPLQVGSGKTVKMSMDVPAELMGAAPAVIPMWSFDEVKGIWIEETIGTLTGGEYVAEIPHFTWWNYDAWFPVAKFGVSFVFESGAPVTQLSVCIGAEIVGAYKCSLTDGEGFICGLVPSGEELLVEVKDACDNVIYSQNVGPIAESDSLILNPITLPETSVITTSVTGEGVDCEGNAIEEGFARVFAGNHHYYFEIEDDGSFGGTTVNCNESDIVLNVIDEGNLKQSLPQTYPFDTNIDVGTITACDDIEQVVTVDIPELDTVYTYLFAESFVNPTWTTVTVQDSNSLENFFSLFFEGVEVGSYNGQLTFSVGDGAGGSVYYNSQNVDIVVTYFGDAGDYIQGTFSGEVIIDGQQTETYDVTGAFSSLRY